MTEPAVVCCVIDKYVLGFHWVRVSHKSPVPDHLDKVKSIGSYVVGSAMKRAF